MSSETVVSIQDLSKCYQIYDRPHHRLLQMLFGRFTKRRFFREFWALRNVSFEVPRGRVIGILGKNGAGKSTLLQILCGILTPTTGRSIIHGRVAALLELGAGFNPEFTGIENIYINGQILGLSRDEIETKIDAIKSFADIGEFIEQPVKTYSSGMFARLAFSVAVHVDPDVLIVDEALSVGDSWFQHKSMAKMRSLMEKGCTVLFVSHSIDAVRALCHEAVWIESGQVKMRGDVTSVTNAYMNEVFIEHNRIALESSSAQNAPALPVEPTQRDDVQTAPTDEPVKLAIVQAAARADGGDVLRVHATRIKNSAGKSVERLEQGEKFEFEFELEFLRPVKNISVGFLVKDQFSQELTGESVFNTYRRSLDFAEGQRARFVFSSTMMLRGGQSYSLALRVNQVSKWDRSDNVVLYADELAAVFEVLSDPQSPMWFKFRQPFEVKVHS